MKAFVLLFKIIPVTILFAFTQNQVTASSQTKPNEPGPWPSIQVNTYTGNLYYERSDLYIPAVGEIPLDIVFSYNSLKNRQDHGYGNGWSFNFGIWYNITGSVVTIYRGDGEEDEFTWNGASYDPPVGVYDVLTEYESGKYQLTTKYGIKYYFESPVHKQLTKIQDRNGNTTNISYTDGKPTTITDPSSRVLNLSWTDSHLSQITDPNTTPSRVINYLYDGSWNMYQVTRPLSNIFQYGYDLSGNMVTVIDPRSNVIYISYDANEAVANIGDIGQTFEYNNCNNTTTVSQVVSGIPCHTIYTFDLNGRVTGKHFPDGSDIYYTWDSENNMTTFINENGITTYYTWDLKGNRLSEFDCLGNTEYYSYDGTYNKVTGFTNKLGWSASYTYDGNGNLTDITDCQGNSESYNYDAYGNLINVIDKNGQWTNYYYDIYGNVTSVYYPLGITESSTYDQVGNRLTSTDKRGFTTTYTYDFLNRHTGTLDALGYTSSYSYDNNGNLVSETNPDSYSTTYGYDALNRLISKTDALGGITSYSRDEAGNTVSETNASGCTTIFTYNSRNWLTSTTDPLGALESYTYDPAGYMLSSTDKGGNTTNYQYDCLGRLTMTSRPDGSVETYAYNALGNKTLYSNNGNSITYDYDCLNRLIAIYYPLGYSELNSYDAVGNRTSFTDKNGNTTTYTYDYKGRILNATDPLSNTETYNYDGEGNKIGYTNKNGNQTIFSYDNAGRLASTSDAYLSTESYILDGVGNRLTVTDKRGYNTYYTYDALNRLISSTEPDGITTETYSYDAMGNIISITDKNGNTTINTYDCNNQKISTTDPLGWPEYFTYNPAGKMTGYTDKNGNTTSWDYSCCRLASITDPLGFSEDYTYDLAGNRLTTSDRNGHVTQYSYDNLNRLVTKTSPFLNLYQYSYDGNGNIVSKSDPNSDITDYTYNARNEIVTVSYPDASTVNYYYDNFGNLVQTTNTGGIGETTDYTYDALNRLITKTTDYGAFTKTISSTYDINGNRTSTTTGSGTINYEYDARNRVIQITDQNSQVTTFEYDGAGNQTSVNYPNGVTTTTQYDAINRAIDVTTADIPVASPVKIKKEDEPAISYEVLFNIDCAVTQILSPVSGPGLTNSEPFIIVLMNYGIAPVFNAVARYSIDGGPPVIQNVSQPLFPGNPVTFTFTQHADLSIPGHTYQLLACVIVTGDQNALNDCMMSVVVNEAPIVYQSFSYQYDAGGNIMSELHEDGSSIIFGYSQRNELISESFLPSGDYNHYTYTHTGKRASKDENGNLSSYTYNDDDVLIAAGDETFTADNNGNRITKDDLSGTTQYAYGFRNELELVTLPDLSFVEYKYDALGRQVRKDVFSAETNLLTDGYELFEEYDASGTSVRYYDPGLSIHEGGFTGYYHYNGFGSTTLQLDPSKAILATAEFDAFGNIRSSSGVWINDAYKFNQWNILQDIGLFGGGGGDFADPVTGERLGNPTQPQKGKTEVTGPESGKPETVTGGKKAEETVKAKCCGVKKFEVKWSKPSGWYLGQMLRLDVDIEFMDDDSHAPACCAYCQNVMTKFSVTAGPDKGWNGDTSPMHDDHYSRGVDYWFGVIGSDDTDGKQHHDDPGFKTNDSPGLPDLDPKSVVDYSFTAEQLVKEACGPPCPTGTVVAKRGPHTATVTGKEPRTFTGVPETLDKDVK